MAKKLTKSRTKRRLLDQVKKLSTDQDPRVANSWHQKLLRDDPESHAELIELVDDWHDGGVSREKFKNITSMYRFLSGKDSQRPLDPPLVTCTASSFRNFVNERCR